MRLAQTASVRNFILLIALLVIAFAKAQTARPYSNEFLNIGVDAAALGMANAVVASSDDVNSVYWNPAGLMQLESKELGLMHSSYFANIAQYNYGAFAMPLDEKSAIGISAIRFSVDDILNTTQLIDEQGNIDYNRISTFSAADWAFTLGYARSTGIEGLNYGANLKIIRRVIGDFADSWGFGIDLGAQYRFGKWQVGAMARDITTTYNTWSIDEEQYAAVSGAVDGENEQLPETTELTLPKLQLGIARNFPIKETMNLLAEIDLHSRFYETNDLISSSAISVAPAVGFQFDYADIVFVRAGAGNFQQVLQISGEEELSFQPNIGLGFKYNGIAINYALTDIGDQSEALYSNVFSLTMDFSIFQ